MKVVLLTSTFPRFEGDAVPDFLLHLAIGLVEMGVEVVVLAPAAPGIPRREFRDGVTIWRFRYAPEMWQKLAYGSGIIGNLRKNPLLIFLLPGFVFSMGWSLLKCIKDIRAELVNVHWIVPQGWVVAFLKKFGFVKRPLVCSLHGSDARIIAGPVLRGLNRWLDASFCKYILAGEGMRSNLVSAGLPSDKIAVRSMGLRSEFFAERSCVLPENKKSVLFVGRLTRQKGVDLLLKSFASLDRSVRDVHLTVVGDGVERAALEALAQELELDSQLYFSGWLGAAELASLMKSCHLLVMPSREEEGFGLVAAEAIASGCRVVIPDFPSVRKNFPEFACDYFEPKCILSLAQAIERSLESDQPASSVLEEFRSNFKWETVAKTYFEIFREAKNAQ